MLYSRLHLCLLRLGGRGAVLVLYAAVRKHLWHGDGAAREVRVVVQALAHLWQQRQPRGGFQGMGMETYTRQRIRSGAVVPSRRGSKGCLGAYVDASGRLTVSQEEGEDVVLAVVAGLGDEAQVGRVGAAVGVAGVGFVHVGGRELVGQLAGALKHLALVVGAVWDLDLCGHGLGLVLAVADAHEVAVVDEVDAVAGSAHLGGRSRARWRSQPLVRLEQLGTTCSGK